MTCCNRGVCPDPQPFSFNTNGTLNSDGTGSVQQNDFWSKDTSYLRKALVSGIAGRQGSNLQVVVSAVVTAIKAIFGAAIDALQHTFKTFAKTIGLLPYSFFWLSAAETPKATPFDMLCEVPKHALKAAVSGAMVLLAPIPAALNPSMTLRVTEAIHLTPAPVIARRASPLPSVPSTPNANKARVEQGRLQKVAHICTKTLWKPLKRLAFWPLGMAKQHPYIATTLSVATAIGIVHLGMQKCGYDSPLTSPINALNEQWNQTQQVFWDLMKGNVTNSDEGNQTATEPTDFVQPTGENVGEDVLNATDTETVIDDTGAMNVEESVNGTATDQHEEVANNSDTDRKVEIKEDPIDVDLSKEDDSIDSEMDTEEGLEKERVQDSAQLGVPTNTSTTDIQESDPTADEQK